MLLIRRFTTWSVETIMEPQSNKIFILLLIFVAVIDFVAPLLIRNLSLPIWINVVLLTVITIVWVLVIDFISTVLIRVMRKKKIR